MLRGVGVAIDQSYQEKAKLKKDLAGVVSPECCSQSVNVSCVEKDRLSRWIERKVEELAGFEDDILSGTILNEIDENREDLNSKVLQLHITAFLGKDNAFKFVEDLWKMMLEEKRRQEETSSQSRNRRRYEDRRYEDRDRRSPRRFEDRRRRHEDTSRSMRGREHRDRERDVSRLSRDHRRSQQHQSNSRSNDRRRPRSRSSSSSSSDMPSSHSDGSNQDRRLSYKHHEGESYQRRLARRKRADARDERDRSRGREQEVDKSKSSTPLYFLDRSAETPKASNPPTEKPIQSESTSSSASETKI